MASYKIIDGIVYQQVDTTEIREKINAVKAKIKPFADGIAESERCISAYQEQIIGYKQQIANIIATENLDPEIVKMVDPESASTLNF